MLRYWLTYYNPHKRLLGVLIVDSYGLSNARFRAAVERLDQGAAFCEGHELDEASAALIPPDEIGRMLSLDEAAKVIQRIERGIPKKPATASVRRRGMVRRARGADAS